MWAPVHLVRNGLIGIGRLNTATFFMGCYNQRTTVSVVNRKYVEQPGNDGKYGSQLKSIGQVMMPLGELVRMNHLVATSIDRNKGLNPLSRWRWRAHQVLDGIFGQGIFFNMAALNDCR